MNDETNRGPESKTAAGNAGLSRGEPVQGRRRLIKGGLSAGPVILTLTSRPVLGFQKACVAPSRMISGNFSGFTGLASCGGTSLNNRKTEADRNPKPTWFNDKFTDVFSPMYANTNGKNIQDKLGEVFLDSYAEGDKYGASQFAAYIIAAYLNSSDGVGSVETVLSVAQVKHMWHDVVTSGSYCPQIAMCWTATGVIGYLQNSGIVPAA